MNKLNIVVCLSGEATEQEQHQLKKWREAAPENEREFQRLNRLWNRLSDLGREPVSQPVPSAQEVIGRAEARTEEAGMHPVIGRRSSRNSTLPRRRLRSRMQEAVIAAALVAAVVLGAMIATSGSDDAQAHRVIATGSDEVATVDLGDGTVARIAPHSRLSFPPSDASRSVELDGKAYFAVAERTGVPFRVRLPAGEIEVLGTRFEAEGTEASVRVAVVEGNVRLAAMGYEVGLRANQVGRSTQAGPPAVQEVENVFEVINWLGSFLAFESTPMRQVAVEFERRFGIRMEFRDSALTDTRVTGSFTDQSPEEMIAGVCTAISARCTVREGIVWVE